MPLSFIVREARAGDNAALVTLDRQCSMGEETVLSFNRAPDFFARSRVYEQSRLFVVEDQGAVVGVGSAAVKRLRVRGEWLKAAYFYDLRVAPTHRRMGVASTLADALRDFARREAVQLGYFLVVEGNIPSLQFGAKQGGRVVKRCLVAILPVDDTGVGESRAWRPLTEKDMGRVSSLVERCFHDHDLVPPVDASALQRLFNRAPGFSISDLYGLESGGDLLACFGLWDYAPIMRMRVSGTRPRMDEAERSLIQAGEVGPQFLLPLAFEEPSFLAEVIRQAQSLLAKRQGHGAVPALTLLYDPEDRAFATLRTLDRFELPLYLLTLTGPEGPALGTNPLYLDPFDL